MKINLKIVPVKEMPFTTLGHWFDTEDGVTILIAELPDWRYTIAVLFHELIEWAVSHQRGVTTEEADAFDQFYEDGYAAGRINPAREAGFDKKCPYGLGHRWGARMERLVIWLLRADFEEYGRVCNEAMSVTEQEQAEVDSELGDSPNFYAEWWPPGVEPTYEAKAQ
jgi:hypothetical protein